MNQLHEKFQKEFRIFLENRRNLRRFMPTSDRFPMFCELVDAAKKYYLNLPNNQQQTRRDIPFSYLEMDWLLRVNLAGAHALERKVIYLDLRAPDTKTIIVTFAVVMPYDILAPKFDLSAS